MGSINNRILRFGEGLSKLNKLKSLNFRINNTCGEAEDIKEIAVGLQTLSNLNNLTVWLI